MNSVLSPLEWTGTALRLLDQRLLPVELLWREYSDHHGVAEAIRSMVVRGAPAIGCAAAFGVVLGARKGASPDDVRALLAATRPTAVNLFWALDRMARVAPATVEALEAE